MRFKDIPLAAHCRNCVQSARSSSTGTGTRICIQCACSLAMRRAQMQLRK
jgi:hypothetical protein